jgi:peptidoglycan-associated lipoprotein
MNTMTMAVLAALAFVAGACSDDGAMVGPTASSGVGGAISAAGAIVPGSEEDLRANVGDRVLFDFDHSLLTPAGKAVLDRQAAWLGKYGQVNVQVAGNCDERGTEEYNIVLGQRRAVAARDYMVAKGVALTRIATTSFGKDRPVELGSDESAWKQNRNAITSVQ